MSDGPPGIEIKSKLRLFLSLDVVGSTEFKQPRTDKHPSDDDSWVRPFLTFYRESVDQMEAQWRRVTDEMKAVGSGAELKYTFGDCPEFWKGAGDEVLFSKLVVSPLDAVAAIRSLMMVMAEHRAQFAAKPQTRGLNVKGTAWLAGFPLNNAEIVIATQTRAAMEGEIDDRLSENYRLLSLLDRDPELRATYKADYIGPSIDLGFRLRDHSTARRMMVSADLVWLMCHADKHTSAGDRQACPHLELPKIGYANRVALKGILAGEGYPLLWVEAETGTELDESEDKLLQRAAHVTSGDVASFCGKFLNGSGPLRMPPYIPGCADPAVGQITPDRLEKVRRLEEYVNGTASQIASLEALDPQGDSQIPEAATKFATEIADKKET